MIRLSPRECDVARLVAQGLDNHDIARALTLAPRTVSLYVETIKRKLQVSTRGKIILWYIEFTNPNIKLFL